MSENFVHQAALIAAVFSIVVISLTIIAYAVAKKNGWNCWIGRQARPFFTIFPYRRWKAVHVFSQGIFGFSAIGLGAIEAGMYLVGRFDAYFHIVSLLDNCIALPSLAVTTFSGLAMTYTRYLAHGKKPPEAIDNVFHLLNLFGAFWLAVDKSVQYLNRPETGQSPPFWIRLVAMIGSAALYYRLRCVMHNMATEKSR